MGAMAFGLVGGAMTRIIEKIVYHHVDPKDTSLLDSTAVQGRSCRRPCTGVHLLSLGSGWIHLLQGGYPVVFGWLERMGTAFADPND
jgi:hypothetical protein